MPYRLEKSPFCNAFAEDPYIYKDLTKKSNFPDDLRTNCPMKPGNYSIDGATFPLEEVPQNSFQSEDYAVEMMFSHGVEEILKCRFYVQIINIE